MPRPPGRRRPSPSGPGSTAASITRHPPAAGRRSCRHQTPRTGRGHRAPRQPQPIVAHRDARRRIEPGRSGGRAPPVGRELEQHDRRPDQQRDHQAQPHHVAERRQGRQDPLRQGHVGRSGTPWSAGGGRPGPSARHTRASGWRSRRAPTPPPPAARSRPDGGPEPIAEAKSRAVAPEVEQLPIARPIGPCIAIIADDQQDAPAPPARAQSPVRDRPGRAAAGGESVRLPHHRRSASTSIESGVGPDARRPIRRRGRRRPGPRAASDRGSMTSNAAILPPTPRTTPGPDSRATAAIRPDSTRPIVRPERFRDQHPPDAIPRPEG